MLAAVLIALIVTAGGVAGQQLLAGEREAVVTAIPGIVAAGVKWESCGPTSRRPMAS